MKPTHAILAFAILLAPVAGQAMQATPDWSLEGTLTDACQCQVMCPCTFLDKPTTGHCDDVIVVHVNKGHYGDIPLDGQSIAVVSASKEGERVVDTVGDLVFANMYVSNRSTPAQREALASLVQAMMGADKGKGPQLSPRDKVHAVPMEVSVDGAHHVVRIPGILELESDPIPSNAEGKPVLVANAPAMPPFLSDLTVRRSKTYRYTDDGKDWKYDGRSASSGTMKVDKKMIEAMTPPGESPLMPKPKDPTAPEPAQPHHH